MTSGAGGDTLATPVLVVGGGPVGLMTALSLDALGVASIVVNTEPTTRWVPKGSTQNARTLEHYRRLGLARAIRSLGLPPDYPTDVGYFTRLNGFELARIAMPSEAAKRRAVAAAPADDQVPEPLLRCNQMYVERLLLDHARTRPRITLRYGWECVDWRDDGGGVSAEIVEGATGRRAAVRAQFLAACDGPQSASRRRLGIRYEGEVLNQAYLGGPMVNSHVRAPAFYDRVRSAPCWQYWAVNPEVRSNIVVLDGKGEFIFTTTLRDAADKPDDAAIARRFNATVGADVGVGFLAHSPWTAGQALVAERLGGGRVFLAGDAAHLFTPTGAFGMNTGVDEAVNLAWKLAAVVQGWGGPGLLATYDRERRGIARRNTQASKALAKNVGAVPVDPAMEDATPAGQAARARASAYLATFGEEFASLGIQLGARYDGSPIVVADGSAPPPDDPTRYVASACPGGRAPHVWLGPAQPDGRGGAATLELRGESPRVSLYDRLGPGFTLLRLRPGVDARPLAAAAEARRIPLAVLDVAEPAARDLYVRDLALIRPDMHVAWRGDALPEDCAALMGRVTGW